MAMLVQNRSVGYIPRQDPLVDEDDAAGGARGEVAAAQGVHRRGGGALQLTTRRGSKTHLQTVLTVKIIIH